MIFYYPIKIILRKFKNDCLKTVGGDKFLMKQSIFEFLGCPFHNEPIKLSGFDPLYLENYFEFSYAVKKHLVAKIKIY